MEKYASTHPVRSPEDFLPGKYPILEFPEDDWKAFRENCLALNLPDPNPKRQVFQAIYSHLCGVNQWLNLTRLTTPADYLKFSLLDSLTLLPVLESLCESQSVVMDLGSGGGYPGLPQIGRAHV